MDRPSDAATLERARSLATEAIYTVALQCRRLRSTEPEDDAFVFRWWADLQFLIVALRRLRRTAELAARIPTTADAMKLAVQTFDAALPRLPQTRNVGEHVDDYAVDAPRRHHKNVDRRQLQVGSFDGTTYHWLGGVLNIDDALSASEALYRTVMALPFPVD